MTAARSEKRMTAASEVQEEPPYFSKAEPPQRPNRPEKPLGASLMCRSASEVPEEPLPGVECECEGSPEMVGKRKGRARSGAEMASALAIREQQFGGISMNSWGKIDKVMNV